MGNKNGSLDPEERSSMTGQLENSYQSRHSNRTTQKSKQNTEESAFVYGSNDAS